jgi:2-dehydropantoate 2-reductase
MSFCAARGNGNHTNWQSKFIKRKVQIALTDKLTILCVGTGAIGTYIGGSLALAKHRVVFVDRTGIANEVRRRGLRLKLGGTEYQVDSPMVVETVGEAFRTGAYDVVLLAVKSFDTMEFVNSIKPYVSVFPPVLCLQNGVENETLLAGVLGVDRVIAATVTSAVGRRAAGDIVLERRRGVGIARGHPLSQKLADAMTEAGLRARLYERVDSMKWSKMLTNLMGNATAAILNMTPAEVFADRFGGWMELLQLREALTVMEALKIPVIDLPATPVRAVSWMVCSLPAFISRHLLQWGVGKGRGAKMPSFHIDLHSGRGKSEVVYLNGAVARFGEQVKVDTPVNRILTNVLLSMTEGQMSLDQFARRPDRLWKYLTEQMGKI